MRALPNGVSGITGTVRERCGHKPGQGRPQFRQLNPIGPGPLYCIEHVGSTSTKDLRFDKYSFCQDCTRKYLSASFTLRGSLVITFAGLASVDPHPSFSIDLIVETKSGYKACQCGNQDMVEALLHGLHALSFVFHVGEKDVGAKPSPLASSRCGAMK